MFMMMCLFGCASVKEILDTRKDPAILFVSPVLAVVGAGLTLYPKLKKDSFESEFAIKAQGHITEEVVYKFERKNDHSTGYNFANILPDTSNPLFPNAKIEFWEQFNKVPPVQVLHEEGKQTGIELQMVPPIEFMSIIRPIFKNSLKVSHNNVSFAPSSKGYGPGKFRLKVKDIPMISYPPTQQEKDLSSAKGFELPEKRGVYGNRKVYLSGKMKSKFMGKHREVVDQLKSPIRTYLEKKYKNSEWDILITYKPKVINGDNEIPSGNQWWIHRVEMDVIINLVQKIPADKIREIEQFYLQQKA